MALRRFTITFFLSAGDITVPLQGDTIFGEGTGLIGAEYVHSTKVLNGVETFHDYLFAAHGKRALGQADGHNHGQHLRGQANGYGHREEECSFPVVLGKPVDEEDQRHHDRHELNHEPCEAAQALIKACWRAFPRDRTRHRAEISTNSRNDNDRGRCAALNACAHEACVVELDRRICCAWVGIVKLLDRERLAGQRTLAHDKILGRKNPDIAWDHVSRGQIDDVSGNEVAKGDLLRLAIPNHCGGYLDYWGPKRTRLNPRSLG